MADNHENHEDHGTGYYFKIYVALLVLFAISVTGPMVGEITGLAWITLITAFGIAIVKARLVIDNFMHLKTEKRIMKWLLTTSLLLMLLMVAGVSVDVLNHEGNNWVNVAAREATARGVDGEPTEGGAEEEPEAEVATGEFNAASTFGVVCAVCHGAGGQGDGPGGLALDPPPADFTEATFWETRDMDRIVQVIANGAASVGGSPAMAPWSSAFTPEQIQALADHVMTFRPN